MHEIFGFVRDGFFKLVSPVLTAFASVGAAQRVCRSPGGGRYHHDGNGDHRNHNGYGGYHGDGHIDANVDNREDRDDDY